MSMGNKTKFCVLGCGTSTGVPCIGCHCKVCRSKNPKNKRLRAALWIQTKEKSILIDTSTDLRQQALREKITQVDAVLYTHPHADHVQGIDELRSFNFIQAKTIPLYGNAWTCQELQTRFPYIFNPGPVEGGGIPNLTLHQISSNSQTIEVAGISVIPISLKHGSKECLAYRFDSVAYVTDCSYIPPESIERLKGLNVLFLDCLRISPHLTHFNLAQALEMVSLVKPKRTFLTHLGHEFGYSHGSKKLPQGVSLAYDGLKISI